MKRLCLIAQLLILFLIASCKQERQQSPSLYLPKDLEATLWAESPMLFNPTNIDVDHKGRIWVTEAVNYRNFNNDSLRSLHHAKGDRIMILEDRDQDGKADVSKIFVQDKDLVSPLGIAIIGNKVIVSCSPHLIIYTDDNADDKPDKKEIFLTGFGGLDHDHSLHAIVGGPDGKWYFNTGNAGPHVVQDKAGWTLRSGSIYTGGSPYNTANQGNMKSDDGKIWVGGLLLRLNSDGTGLKVLGHNFRNSYESVVDSYGNFWQNDNDDQVVACRTSWLMEGGNAGYFSTDGTRYWQADQRPSQDIFTAHWHQDDPGVMPAGDRSGAGAPTGIVLNEDDELGEQYRGLLLSADAGRNVIFGYHPTLHESGYDLGARSNFITSLTTDNELYVWNDSAQNIKKDKWFRPSDVAMGTDGSIYVADWYDPVVGGHQMQDSTGYGRIYRIVAKGKKPRAPVLDLNTLRGQIEAAKSPAINVRATAIQLIPEHGESALGPLKDMMDSKNPYHQARAIWLLSLLGGKGEEEVIKLLEHNDVLVRATAFRALRQTSRDILPLAEKLSRDTSAFVRREVAIALRDIPFEKTKYILRSLAEQFNGSDKWYLESLAAACAGHEEEFYKEVSKFHNPDHLSSVQWNEKFASFAWRLHPPSAVNDLKLRAGSEKVTPGERARALTALSFINTRPAVVAMIDLSRSSLNDVKEQASYWVAFRQSNDWFALVDWSKSGIDTENERRIAAMKVKMSKILDEKLPFDEKKWNARDMANDEVGGQMLLGMVGEGKLPANLYDVVAANIFKNPSEAVRIQASNVFKKPGPETVYSLDVIVKLKGSAVDGKTLFLKNCATCHRVNEEGSDVGPDLTLIGKKFDHVTLLDAIVNPNAGIVFGYEPWLVTTKEGISFYGFLVADGDKALVIKDITGKKHTIRTDQVKSRKKQETSLMPQPSSLGLTDQNLADLTEYLMTLK